MGRELPGTTKEITVDWLNEALRENGILGSTNIVSLKHEQIGVGEGLTSDIARIRLTYDSKTGQGLNSIIAKLPSSFEPIRKVCMGLKIYEREICFYKEIVPLSPVHTPICYFGDIDLDNDRYVLLLEDCARYTKADPDLEGVDFGQLKLIALAIADFHARWWDDETLESYQWLPKIDRTVSDTAINDYRRYWESCSIVEEFKQSLPEGGFEASKRIYDNYHLMKVIAPRDNLTILHCDFKADNIYFDHGNNEQPVVIFDWGTSILWRGVADLSRLFGTSVSTDLRRKTEKELIHIYRERLLDNGISNYSYQECWRDYLTGYLRFSMYPLLTFIAADLSNSRSMKYAVQHTNRWYSAIVDNDATSLLT